MFSPSVYRFKVSFYFAQLQPLNGSARESERFLNTWSLHYLLCWNALGLWVWVTQTFQVSVHSLYLEKHWYLCPFKRAKKGCLHKHAWTQSHDRVQITVKIYIIWIDAMPVHSNHRNDEEWSEMKTAILSWLQNDGARGFSIDQLN